MEHKGTFQHIEFVFDLDHPEIFNVLNMVYFKRKETVKSLNVIQHPPCRRGSADILPCKPRRYYCDIHALSPETRHGRFEADQVNKQAATH